MQPNFADQLLQTLSRTFIHSLWLGLVLSVVAGMIMLTTRKVSASLRYTLLTASYFLFLLALSGAFYIEWNSFGAGNAAMAVPVHLNGTTASFPQLWLQDLFDGISALLNANSFRIVMIWTIVLFFKAGKMLIDLRYVSRMRYCQIYSPEEEWVLKIKQLAESVGIRKTVSLAESALVKAPVVIGHLKPLVLMPVGILTRLSPGEVEAVLLHELAHIRRHDYLVNFIQRITETLLFFNPGLLWVSSLMRVEREHCCDDIAITKTADRLQFAEALISFKEYSMNSQQYALGLFGKKSLLLHRMMRIVYKRNKTLSPFELVFFAANLIIFCLLILGKGRSQGHEREALIPLTSYVQPEQAFSAKRLRYIKVSSEVQKNAEAAAPVKAISGKKEVIEKTGSAEQEEAGPVEHTEVSEENIGKALLIRQQLYRQDIEQHERHRLQAEHDRAEAEIHRREAEKNRLQAEEDRARAEIDRMNAAWHREQAQRDREQAEKNREQAEKDRAMAEIRRKKAEEDRKTLEAALQQP